MQQLIEQSVDHQTKCLTGYWIRFNSTQLLASLANVSLFWNYFEKCQISPFSNCVCNESDLAAKLNIWLGQKMLNLATFIEKQYLRDSIKMSNLVIKILLFSTGFCCYFCGKKPSKCIWAFLQFLDT